MAFFNLSVNPTSKKIYTVIKNGNNWSAIMKNGEKDLRYVLCLGIIELKYGFF